MDDAKMKKAKTAAPQADPPTTKRDGADAPPSAKRGLRIVRENPLGLILCGLAVGLIAGAIAPVTDVERDTFVPIREELVEHAQHAVSDVVDHGKRVVEETVAAATESATKHGQELTAELQKEFGIEQAADENAGSKPSA